jgi:hypothetical protein
MVANNSPDPTVHEQDWGAMNLIPITSLNEAQTHQLCELYQGPAHSDGESTR